MLGSTVSMLMEILLSYDESMCFHLYFSCVFHTNWTFECVTYSISSNCHKKDSRIIWNLSFWNINFFTSIKLLKTHFFIKLFDTKERGEGVYFNYLFVSIQLFQAKDLYLHWHLSIKKSNGNYQSENLLNKYVQTVYIN